MLDTLRVRERAHVTCPSPGPSRQERRGLQAADAGWCVQAERCGP